jgi:peroxiredoxin
MALGLCLLLPATVPGYDLLTASKMQPGESAEDFTLEKPGGELISFASLKGKVLLLTFWDCYADVCFTSVKPLEDMIAKFPPGKFQAVTICYEVPPAMAADNYAGLMKNCSRGQLILLDKERKVKEQYRVKAPATTIVIDKGFVIREKVIGVPALRDKAFLDKLDRLVADIP